MTLPVPFDKSLLAVLIPLSADAVSCGGSSVPGRKLVFKGGTGTGMEMPDAEDWSRDPPPTDPAARGWV